MIAAFARSRGATFPLFSKVNVNGEETAPLFGFLKNSIENGIFGTFVKWNFTKVKRRRCRIHSSFLAMLVD